MCVVCAAIRCYLWIDAHPKIRNLVLLQAPILPYFTEKDDVSDPEKLIITHLNALRLRTSVPLEDVEDTMPAMQEQLKEAYKNNIRLTNILSGMLGRVPIIENTFKLVDASFVRCLTDEEKNVVNGMQFITLETKAHATST